MWLTIMLVTIIVVLCAVISLCVYRIVQLVNVVDRLAERVEKSLDTLDKAYSEISFVARSEILSDEPLIRRVVAAIKSAQDAVLLVANELVDFGENDSEE